jgi:hypothetical protein
MSRTQPIDPGIRNLLDLHSTQIEVGAGYWAKFEAQEVEADARRPDGIKYSLTLHAPSGERVIGFDNAHGVKGARHTRWDHSHPAGGEIRPYTFRDAGKLLEDFWKSVERYMHNQGLWP